MVRSGRDSFGDPLARREPLDERREGPAGGEDGLTDREFEVFRGLVYTHTGITLNPHKRQLLQARLGRRLRVLGLTTFTEYHQFLTEQDPTGKELGCFVNAITTNKTDFFREAHHFRYLADEWMPAIKIRAARTGDRSIRIWSAGCSSGEEPYTIAMTIREALGPAAGWDVRILASDLDTDVLARAEAGVYSAEQTAPVPSALLTRHFLRGRGESAGRVRVRPELRALITFRRINFMDARWPIRPRLDIIFCRNVLIYFDRPTQQRILERFLALLKEDGLLVLGHSESVHGLLNGVQHLGNTMYRRIPAAPTADASP
jgi:chemotaxis protein methyltransferase CheR